MPELYIENISLPPAVEAALDKRTSMGIVGDVNKYMQFNAAEAMGQPGSATSAGMGAAMGTGMGAGMGMAMGAQMAPQQAHGALRRAGRTQPAPPPPPPAAAAAAGRTCLAHRRERPDKGPVFQGLVGAHARRWRADPRNPCLDRRAGWLDAGRGRDRTGAALHRPAAATAAATG